MPPPSPIANVLMPDAVEHATLIGADRLPVDQVADVDRTNPDDITGIYVRSRGGTMVPLANLVRAQETVAPKELNHFNRIRAAIISANVAPGYSLGEALEFLDRTSEEVIGKGAQTQLDGVSREFRESSGTLYLTFVLALIFIGNRLSGENASFTSSYGTSCVAPQKPHPCDCRDASNTEMAWQLWHFTCCFCTPQPRCVSGMPRSASRVMRSERSSSAAKVSSSPTPSPHACESPRIATRATPFLRSTEWLGPRWPASLIVTWVSNSLPP